MLNYFKSEDGSAMAEYALVLTILGAGLALAVINFKAATKAAVESAATTVAVAASGSTNSTGSTGDTGDTNSTNTTGNCKPKKNC
jgi:type II secretory pathway pseudopilin PulG